ncbi:MAG: hypothetical protein SNJ33_01230 [Rikenellaceae bacterium]
MKKITTLFALLSVVSLTTMAQSHSSSYQSATRSADTILLSTRVQGDYTVRDLLVKETSSTGDEFTLAYKINASELNSAYRGNSSTLNGLESFISSIKGDPLKKIVRYKVTGYASPDGSMSANERLAMQRATLFREYLDDNYGMESYPAMVDAVAEPWYATASLVRGMNVPNKAKVLSIVDSDKAPSAIESELKALPSSWSYFTSNLLPSMRCVELEVTYNSWKEIEVHTQNYIPEEIIITEFIESRPEPRDGHNSRTSRDSRYMDDGVTGIIFINDTPMDFEQRWSMRDRGGFAKVNSKFRFR